MNEFTSLILIFPFAISLHNVEEALWLPSWSKNAGCFHKPVNKSEFHFALVVITTLAYLSSFLLLLFPHNFIVKYIYFGFIGAMLINTLFPHIIATLLLHQYAPGVVTAVFLEIPCFTIILLMSIENCIISIPELLISAVFVGVILLILIPMLFNIGNSLFEEEN